MSPPLVDENEGPDGFLVFQQGERQHGAHGIALILGGEGNGLGNVVVPNDLLADQEVADDGAADGVGRVGHVVVFVHRGGGKDDVGGLRFEEPQGGDFGDAEVHGLADDDLVQVVQVDRGAEGLGEVVEVGQAFDGLEHADRLLLTFEGLVEGDRGVPEEGLERGHLRAGLLGLREQQLRAPTWPSASSGMAMQVWIAAGRSLSRGSSEAWKSSGRSRSRACRAAGRGRLPCLAGRNAEGRVSSLRPRPRRRRRAGWRYRRSRRARRRRPRSARSTSRPSSPSGPGSRSAPALRGPRPPSCSRDPRIRWPRLLGLRAPRSSRPPSPCPCGSRRRSRAASSPEAS